MGGRKPAAQDFEIRFFEGVTRSCPNYVDALIPLAEAYTAKGDYRQGLAIDQRLSQLCPKDPTVFYNLACSLALVGEMAAAVKTLHVAVELGYSDFAYMRQDPDLNSLHGDSEFKKLSGLKE